MTGRAVGSIVLVLYCRPCRRTASIIEIFSGIARSGRLFHWIVEELVPISFSFNRPETGLWFSGVQTEWCRSAGNTGCCFFWGWWCKSNACVPCSITCCEYFWSIYTSVTLPLTLTLPCRRCIKWMLNRDNIPVLRSACFFSETTQCISVKRGSGGWVYSTGCYSLILTIWRLKTEAEKKKNRSK
jgi:hypothetical protein